MGGFHSFIGSCSSLDAELWGILRGLIMVKRENLKQVIFECDSKEAIELIHKARYSGFTFKVASELINLSFPMSLEFLIDVLTG
ncbi:ribonuclease H [Senna tora]|uniref:Ribonuclease H n=1 Tax=Senna tora TaxID=362788 RepID=A0A834WQN7_9FABA|nr:ribonuclease H [Senna tora]